MTSFPKPPPKPPPADLQHYMDAAARGAELRRAVKEHLRLPTSKSIVKLKKLVADD